MKTYACSTDIWYTWQRSMCKYICSNNKSGERRPMECLLLDFAKNVNTYQQLSVGEICVCVRVSVYELFFCK